MIEVKAVRRAEEAPQNAGHIYARDAEAAPGLSRAAAAFAGVIIALAAYVQSLFARTAPEHPPLPKEPAADETAAAEALTREDGEQDEAPAARKPEEMSPEDETASIGNDKEKAVGSSGPFEPMPGLPDYLGIDSPMFDFEKFPFVPRGEFRFPIGFDTDASNDNGVRLSFSFSMGDSGGGGGGISLPDIISGPPVRPGPGGGDDDDPPGPGPGPDPEPRNRAPRVGQALRLADVGACQTLTLTMAMLLLGSSDADGDPLGIRNLHASRGQLERTADGWVYTPEAGYYGPVSLIYQVSDGIAAVVQTARFDVVEVLVQVGTQQGDTLTGTDCRDRLEGLGGDDVLDGRGADDVLLGGAGNDVIYGGAGNDLIEGGSGNDVIYGGTGNDVIWGGSGNDIIHGDAGDDIIHGDAGDDVIYGGAGDDRLFGGSGNDHVAGGEGNDVIFGDEGADRLVGEDGDDTIHGGADDDIIEGGAGDDRISGDEGNDIAFGGAGNDRMEGGTGNDALLGEAGNDCLIGGEGDDYLAGGDGQDELRGSAGNDTLSGGGGSDHVDGGSGCDTVIVDADCADDVYEGGSGTDTLDLSQLSVGAFVDLASGELHSSQVGEDRIDGFEVVIGGAGDDTFLIGEQTAMTLSGGRGRDTFKFEVDGEGAGEEAGELIHRILDLEVGDKIVVKQYALHSDGDDDDHGGQRDQDGFTRIYGDGEDDRPFRFRIEKIGERESTFIDVLIEQEGEKDFSIEISGSHRFYYYSFN